MLKLIEAYKANPTLANARKLVTYDTKHPMARIMMLPDELVILTIARCHVALGKCPDRD